MKHAVGARSGWPERMSKNSAHSPERPGVGHVPGDEDEVQRSGGVLGLKASHDPSHARVAARAAPPALDSKAITLADDMDVGEMRDAPDAIHLKRRGDRISRRSSG